MSDDLVGWLTAQIGEDKQIAGELSADGWPKYDGRVLSVEGTLPVPWPDRWNPVRVLAECDAKRRLVDGLAAVVRGEYIDDGELPQAEWALTLLALPYSDRPGYREEWRP